MSKETTTDSSRDKALAAALGQIEKQFGKGAIMKMDGEGLAVEVIPTGSINLDLALGVGGLPKGRIAEIYGPESAGKTTMIYHLLAECQKQGGRAVFIDAEHAMDPIYAANIGVDVNELLVSQPMTGEEALEIADLMTRSGAVDLIAVDSVAALTPKAELEGMMGQATVGLQARMMGQAMRKLAGNLNSTKTSLIFTNQIREKIGVMFGSPETTPGGRALKFYSSVRLDIRRSGPLKGKDENGIELVVGNETRIKVVKNKVAPPFRQAEFDIMFGLGVSKQGEILINGVDLDIIQKSGSFFSYGDTRLGQGKENAREFLRDPENAELANEIEQKVREGLGIIPSSEIPEEDILPSAEEEAEFEKEVVSLDGSADLAADNDNGIDSSREL